MMVSPVPVEVSSDLRMCCPNQSRKVLTCSCSCLCCFKQARAEDLYSSQLCVRSMLQVGGVMVMVGEKEECYLP